jgi:hypothetical protein
MNYEKLLMILATSQLAYFDGEGGTGEGGTGEGGTGEGAGAAKTFTQEEVNTMMANHRKNLQAEHAKKVSELQEATKNLSLTQEERDNIAAKMHDLEATLLTQKELADREKARLLEESKTALATAEAQAKTWKIKHDDLLVTNALIQATSIEGQKAVNPAQIVDLFKSKVDIGEKDGVPVLSMKVNTKGADGQPKVLQLSLQDAMKEFANDSNYANLFVSNRQDGMGRQKTNFQQDPKSVPTNLKDYKASRDQIINS